ncbi:MAG TPA: hypothetical protein VG944_11250 [Fimbriimonas sp.]|nr:hypothetical protein [Fimbriimonas sp.]
MSVRAFMAGRKARGKVLFTAADTRAEVFAVRGEQIAQEIGGLALRSSFLSQNAVLSAPALFWVQGAEIPKVRFYHGTTPQILDVVDVVADVGHRSLFYEKCRAFRFLVLTTRSMKNYAGPVPEHGWKSWVVPFHHDNASRYEMPESQLERPRMIGFVGDAKKLQSIEVIESHVRKMGFAFIVFPKADDTAYEQIDVGIHWTHPDAARDETANNSMLTNYLSRGIPCVMPDYESYRDVEEALEGPCCLRAKTLSDWFEKLAELMKDEALRRSFAAKAEAARIRYSLHSTGLLYKGVIAEARSEPDFYGQVGG